MSDTPTASPVVLGRWEKPGNLASIAALAAAGQVTILPHELIRTTDGRVYHWTGTALEITSAPVHHGTVADIAALDGVYLLPSCTRGVHQGDTAYVTAATCEYRVTSGINATATWTACATLPTIPTTPAEVGADPAGSAADAVSAHNSATDSHADIRTLVGDRVPISTTRLGSVGNTPLTTTTLSAADWAALPVGWRGILSADVALASGLPAADVYHLQKVSNRDVSGGAAYQAQGYLSPTLYVGVAATSADIPTWSVALTSAPGTTVSDVGASLLALATPTAQKIPRINANGSVTLIDVPTGGGGSVPGPLEILGVRGDHLWADPAMLTGYTNGQAITDSINTYTLGPRTSVNLRIAGAPTYLSGVLNGHPVANFSGTAALTAISHAACSGQPFTAYFVLKFASLASAYTALLGPAYDEGFFVKSTGKSSWYSSVANYDGSGAVTYSVGTWYVLTVRVGFGGLVVRANGVTDYAAASRLYAFSSASQQIVVGYPLGQAGSAMYGQIAAFILADAEHTDGEVSIVESALASRFAL